MASWYTSGLKAVMEGSVNLSTATVKVALVGSGYTPSKAHTSFATDVASQETTGAGYTAGGVTLTGKAFVVSGNEVTFDAADSVFNGLTASFRYAVIYSGDTLLGYMDLGSKTITNKNLTIKWEYTTRNPITNEIEDQGSGLLKGTA